MWVVIIHAQTGKMGIALVYDGGRWLVDFVGFIEETKADFLFIGEEVVYNFWILM